MFIKSLVAALVIVGSSAGAMAAPMIRDHRTEMPTRYQPVRFDQRRPVVEAPAQPAHVTFTTEDCSNWDPTVDSSNCGRELKANTRVENPWSALGSRDSSMSDHQYITVEAQYRELRFEALTGAPSLDKVAIRYTDGSVQVVNPGAVRECGAIGLARKEISQIVMYSAPGSRGTYSVYAV